MALEYTVCLVCDSHYLNHLRWTSQTWRIFRPEMFHMPWAVVYDTSMSASDVYDLVAICPHDTNFQEWPPAYVHYETQRERMLSAWIFAIPFMVETEWYFKIDCDAFAERWDDSWSFEYHLTGGEVALHSAWSYSKPAEYITIMQDWFDRHPVLSKYPRLPITVHPGHETCRCKRFASWCGLYKSAVVRENASYCSSLKLPVPSEDTFNWFCMERMGRKWTHYSNKACGWSNIRNKNRIEARVREILSIT